jgi:hypothetical protein
MRHSDHRFEWTPAEFQAWGSRVASEHGYTVTFREIGDGATQMGLFT